MSDGKLMDLVAIVTGGTSGIGFASARLFAQEGATVIITGRNTDRGRCAEEALTREGLKAEFQQCDVTNEADVKNLHEYVAKKYARLNVLMNNSGILITDALEDITDEEWDDMYDGNVKSVMHMCREFIGMLKLSHGVILNNASINGLHSYIKGRKSYMYASSKAATIQFTRYLAKNYAPDVRVNCLCPGMTETNLFTNRDFSRFKGCNLMDRMAKPEEIGKVALFLVSSDSSFMTGSIIVADGGETIM